MSSRRSRAPRPLGPVHSVTLFPPLRPCMHACCFQLHLTHFTMLKYILQIFPVEMQLKCIFALVIRAQTAQNLITGLDLKFTIMISLLMMHKEFLHMVFTVCSLQIHICLEAHEILIPDKMVLFVLNLLSIMYLHIRDLHRAFTVYCLHDLCSFSI